MPRQVLLGFARTGQQQTRILDGERPEFGGFEYPAEDTLVEIVTTQRRITARRQHFEDTTREIEDRDVEGAATKVVHRVDAFGSVVESVSDRCCGRFVKQTQHRETGELGRVLGRLALGVIEICRHRDHGADQRATKRCLGTQAQHTQDVCGDFHRALDSGERAQPHHPGAVLELVGQRFAMGDVLQSAPHEALDRRDRVARVLRLLILRFVADHGFFVRPITHDRR